MTGKPGSAYRPGAADPLPPGVRRRPLKPRETKSLMTICTPTTPDRSSLAGVLVMSRARARA